MSKLLLAFATGAMAVVVGASSAAAAPAATAPGHRADMTCQEFLTLDAVTQPKVVYWVEGMKHKGKGRNVMIDTVSTDQIVPIVSQECQVEPKATVWQKLDTAWHKFEASAKKHL